MRDEITHTQQVGLEADDQGTTNLLGKVIEEGACEFIAELIMKKQFMFPCMTYGRLHEKELWEKFKRKCMVNELED